MLSYIEAWVANDPERIAALVAEDCVITECYGPVYRGRDNVRSWATNWVGHGGVVHRWTLTDHFAVGNREAAQWAFECTWDGRRNAFEGATIARNVGDRIVELREYQTTAALYDWVAAAG